MNIRFFLWVGICLGWVKIGSGATIDMPSIRGKVTAKSEIIAKGNIIRKSEPVAQDETVSKSRVMDGQKTVYSDVAAIPDANKALDIQDKKNIVHANAPVNVPTNVHVVATRNAKISLLLCYLTDQSRSVEPLIPILKRDFMFSDQIEVTVKHVVGTPTRQDIKKLFADGYPLALFITQSEGQGFEWRLFDTLQGKMVNGKRCIQKGNFVEGWAHTLADSVWPTLTGLDPFFSSKIAYCKQIDLAGGRRAKQIYIADYEGSNEQVLVQTSTPTVYVALRWNTDALRPLLFYSEYTNENIRLMYVDMDKNRRIASSFNGVNMLPAFSKDGAKVVYCASHGTGNCQLYYGEKGIFKQITDNKGSNVSPTLFDDGSAIIFCSDFQTGQPQIYKYTVDNQLIERLTQGGGYCASPCYSGKRHQIAYGKMEHGIMQLHLYDIKTKTDTRLTSDAGNKEEYSWSPCGNYLLFSVEKNRESRIASLSLLTKKVTYITPSGSHCSYPSWSPLYNRYPSI